MEKSLRIPAATLLGIAAAAALVAQLPFLDFEAGSHGSATNREQVWTATLTIAPGEKAALPANGTAPAANYAWFDSDLNAAKGITQVRLAGPMMLFGILVVAAAVVVVVGRRTLEGGLMGMLGTLIFTAGFLLLLLGLNDINRNPGDFSRFRLGLGPGFYVLLVAGVCALVGSVFAIAEKRDTTPAGAGAGAALNPVLSTENPRAFDPLASKDPKPFKPDPPRDFKEFRVKPGQARPGGTGEGGDDTSDPVEETQP